MRSGFIILPGILLTLSACGRGGATLDTDNVKAEWFPNGSRTAIVLDNETEPPAGARVQNAPAALTLLYTSQGNNQGMLSVNGAFPENATLDQEKPNAAGTMRFQTASREIRLHEVRRSSVNGNTAVISGWSYQEREETAPRTGTAGSLLITSNASSTQ